MDIVVMVIQVLLKYGPDAYVTVRKLLSQTTPPTDAQWAELDAILAKTGESYFAVKPVVPVPLGSPKP